MQNVYEDEILSGYIDAINQKGILAGYLHQFSILDLHPELREQINFPAFYTSKYLTNTNIWIGPKGTKSKLHYDSDHNLCVQIYGRKIVTLISPEDSDNCYTVNETWYDAFSPIDVMSVDYKKHPKFKNVKMYQVVLSPGDMLYIPKGWWHDIRSLEKSISINLWWIDWSDFVRETFNEIYYSIVEGKEFEIKNSYLYHFKKNITE